MEVDVQGIDERARSGILWLRSGGEMGSRTIGRGCQEARVRVWRYVGFGGSLDVL